MSPRRQLELICTQGLRSCVRPLPQLAFILTVLATPAFSSGAARDVESSAVEHALRATLVVNNSVLFVGDSTEIIVTVKNISSQPVSLPSLLGFQPGCLNVRGKTGESLARFDLVTFNFDREAFQEEKIIQADEELRFPFSATLKKMTLRDKSKSGAPFVTSVFLDLWAFAILIPAPGQYDLWFEAPIWCKLKDSTDPQSAETMPCARLTSDPVTLFLRLTQD
jgi:hypothetical protein